MFTSAVSALLGLTAAALLMHAVGMWATFRFMRRRERARRSPGAAALPGLTLLKPLKGVEDELEANLRSFYEQSYPGALQVVFATTEANDPALDVARAMAWRYPAVETTFVLSRDDFGHNPKVSNMRGALLAARHDLVLQSDANVRLAPGFLQRVVEEALGGGASLLGSLVVGRGERSVGATLENLQLTAFTAPGLCMAKELANVSCVLGKAMLFRKGELEALGGLAAVKDVLAEDYVLAQRFERAGKRVLLSTATVENVNVETPLGRFCARHSRWLKMRAVVSWPGFVADLGSNPLPFALAAWLISGFDARLSPVVLGVWLYKVYWDRRLLLRLRGHGLGLRQLWASPARDAVLGGLWLYSALSRTTEWRGRRFRLGKGSVLTPLPSTRLDPSAASAGAQSRSR